MDGFEFDLSNLSVAEYRKLLAINLIDKKSYEEGVPLLAKRVKKTPFEGDPSAVEFYEGLDVFEQWTPLVNAFVKAVAGRAKALGK